MRFNTAEQIHPLSDVSKPSWLLIKLPNVFSTSKSCELGLAICKKKVVSNSSSRNFSTRTSSTTGLALGIEPVTYGTAGQLSTN